MEMISREEKDGKDGAEEAIKTLLKFVEDLEKEGKSFGLRTDTIRKVIVMAQNWLYDV